MFFLLVQAWTAAFYIIQVRRWFFFIDLLLTHHLMMCSQLASCVTITEPLQFTLKQQHKIISFLTPASEKDMIRSKVKQKKKTILCESVVVMLCQTLRCRKNKPVNQLWQSLRGTVTTMFYCVANTEEISFHMNFLCLHLFECKYDSLVLVYYSLSDDLSPRMNHLWGDLFSKRNKIINYYGTGCKKTLYNYFCPRIMVSFSLR